MQPVSIYTVQNSASRDMAIKSVNKLKITLTLEQTFRDSFRIRDVLVPDSFYCPQTKHESGIKSSQIRHECRML